MISIECFNNEKLFKTWNYSLVEDHRKLIIDSLAVLIGDYQVYRKKAALLILKAFVRDEFLKVILNDENIYPISRNDIRVRKWTKEVLSARKCKKCGSKNNLEAHHILYWSEYPKGRADIKNGICLCVECHAKEHEGEKAEKLILSKI